MQYQQYQKYRQNRHDRSEPFDGADPNRCGRRGGSNRDRCFNLEELGQDNPGTQKDPGHFKNHIPDRLRLHQRDRVPRILPNHGHFQFKADVASTSWSVNQSHLIHQGELGHDLERY